jgi:hypothetical protein
VFGVHIIAVSPLKENSTVQLVLSILKRVFPKRDA